MPRFLVHAEDWLTSLRSSAPNVVIVLRELPNPENSPYFFWNGTSASASLGKRW